MRSLTGGLESTECNVSSNDSPESSSCVSTTSLKCAVQTLQSDFITSRETPIASFSLSDIRARAAGALSLNACSFFTSLEDPCVSMKYIPLFFTRTSLYCQIVCVIDLFRSNVKGGCGSTCTLDSRLVGEPKCLDRQQFSMLFQVDHHRFRKLRLFKSELKEHISWQRVEQNRKRVIAFWKRKLIQIDFVVTVLISRIVEQIEKLVCTVPKSCASGSAPSGLGRGDFASSIKFFCAIGGKPSKGKDNMPDLTYCRSNVMNGAIAVGKSTISALC